MKIESYWLGKKELIIHLIWTLDKPPMNRKPSWTRSGFHSTPAWIYICIFMKVTGAFREVIRARPRSRVAWSLFWLFWRYFCVSCMLMKWFNVSLSAYLCLPQKIEKPINNCTRDIEITLNAGKYKPSWRRPKFNPFSRLALWLYFIMVTIIIWWYACQQADS